MQYTITHTIVIKINNGVKILLDVIVILFWASQLFKNLEVTIITHMYNSHIFLKMLAKN